MYFWLSLFVAQCKLDCCGIGAVLSFAYAGVVLSGKRILSPLCVSALNSIASQPDGSPSMGRASLVYRLQTLEGKVAPLKADALATLKYFFWQLLYAQGILLGPSIFFAKISIFLLYLRIFTIKKQLRYAIYAGMVFTFCLYWINIGLESHFCAPRPGRNWDTAEIAPRCTKTVIWGLIQGVLVVVLDIYIFILPVPTIIRLKLPLKKRLGVLAVFMTAAL